MKKLNELYNCDYDVEIDDIKINSKEVNKGDIFVCTTGITADRHDFIEEAINNGASAIVVSKDVNFNVPTIKVEDTNKELPLLAMKLFDYPQKKLNIIATTGTNGKTTVASIIQQLLGEDICAYMGTNGAICKKFRETLKNTTPDADRLYKYFDKFVKAEAKYLSIETSSEAYFRNRLDYIEFKVGIITNITEDHLNIHKTIENYVESKLKLLDHIIPDGYAILNKDDQYYDMELKRVKSNVLTYGKKEADLSFENYKLEKDKTIIDFNYKNNIYKVASPLVGEFNIYNLAGAILALISLGMNIDEIINRIPNIKNPSGRVDFLSYGQNYSIVLDYAHTPDALEKVLGMLKQIKTNRIITVTGSAGGRQKDKRGPMGKIVSDLSDHVIFTMDDPRNEKVLDIIKDMLTNVTKNNYEIIEDRTEAIKKALSIAKENDIVLITGKGTDNYMAINDEYLPYSDKEEIDKYFN
ncbi:MAG: UDP-N-acetylmuramoyl-L-alanyl-D-glutamate--2,6-diaminopimelate ligase [Bacilli bacterium]|nr:UDP-N-acetylmuramoyl-L-alanyl-D-glutamate--2,6-diaminopimelate ligase [Bacilli bacterium]